MNTPGLTGYLLAWLAADTLFAGIVTLSMLAEPDATLVDLVAWALLAASYVGVASIPFAVVGILLVHAACFRVRAQWVHVAAAGVAGLIPAVLFWSLLGEWPGWPYDGLPIATALGRWAVVPLVHHRRRDSARALARC